MLKYLLIICSLILLVLLLLNKNKKEILIPVLSLLSILIIIIILAFFGYWNYFYLISGNNKTSLIEGELVNIITSLSMPMPSPAVGGIPYSNASM